MAMPSFTAAQWQERARRVRSIIQYLADPSARSEMAMLARAYEQLASEASMRERHAVAAAHTESAVH